MESGMEMLGHDFHGLDPYVRRQHGVQGPVELHNIPSGGESHGRHLAGGVDSAIGSPRAHNRISFTRQLLEGVFQLSLDGPTTRLRLEAGLIIVASGVTSGCRVSCSCRRCGLGLYGARSSRLSWFLGACGQRQS